MKLSEEDASKIKVAYAQSHLMHSEANSSERLLFKLA